MILFWSKIHFISSPLFHFFLVNLTISPCQFNFIIEIRRRYCMYIVFSFIFHWIKFWFPPSLNSTNYHYQLSNFILIIISSSLKNKKMLFNKLNFSLFIPFSFFCWNVRWIFTLSNSTNEMIELKKHWIYTSL